MYLRGTLIVLHLHVVESFRKVMNFDNYMIKSKDSMLIIQRDGTF